MRRRRKGGREGIRKGGKEIIPCIGTWKALSKSLFYLPHSLNDFKIFLFITVFKQSDYDILWYNFIWVSCAWFY